MNKIKNGRRICSKIKFVAFAIIPMCLLAMIVMISVVQAATIKGKESTKDKVSLDVSWDSVRVTVTVDNSHTEKLTAVSLALAVDVAKGENKVDFRFADALKDTVSGSRYDGKTLYIFVVGQDVIFDENDTIFLGELSVGDKTSKDALSANVGYKDGSLEVVNSFFGSRTLTSVEAELVKIDNENKTTQEPTTEKPGQTETTTESGKPEPTTERPGQTETTTESGKPESTTERPGQTETTTESGKPEPTTERPGQTETTTESGKPEPTTERPGQTETTMESGKPEVTTERPGQTETTTESGKPEPTTERPGQTETTTESGKTEPMTEKPGQSGTTTGVNNGNIQNNGGTAHENASNIAQDNTRTSNDDNNLSSTSESVEKTDADQQETTKQSLENVKDTTSDSQEKTSDEIEMTGKNNSSTWSRIMMFLIMALVIVVVVGAGLVLYLKLKK